MSKKDSIAGAARSRTVAMPALHHTASANAVSMCARVISRSCTKTGTIAYNSARANAIWISVAVTMPNSTFVMYRPSTAKRTNWPRPCEPTPTADHVNRLASRDRRWEGWDIRIRARGC